MMGGRLKIILVASLVLNVFLVGSAAGVLMMRGRLAEFVGDPPPLRRAPIMREARALSPQSRTAFLEMMRGKAAEIQPILGDGRQARREAMEAFAAPTFDPDVASAALARARAADGRSRAVLEQAVVDFARTLGPGERAVLGRSLRRGPGLGPRARPGGPPQPQPAPGGGPP